MENIRRALARAKSSLSQAEGELVAPLAPSSPQILQVDLNEALLRSNRIIAHARLDHRARAFDILRAQVLQTMDQKRWQFLAVTSPTPKCGKTFTAINLAISIARHRERSVLLLDMDLRKPQVANSLGFEHRPGLV